MIPHEDKDDDYDDGDDDHDGDDHDDCKCGATSGLGRTCLTNSKRLMTQLHETMRLCAFAESSAEKSAASDITLVILSRSPVLATQITRYYI